ncbi:hypothetical protein C8J56DRAFT_883551 [Mycena floridula]|nr:hypothetical protein C8J56DRAFT_883551 [Mycena floridula]
MSFEDPRLSSSNSVSSNSLASNYGPRSSEPRPSSSNSRMSLVYPATVNPVHPDSRQQFQQDECVFQLVISSIIRLHLFLQLVVPLAIELGVSIFVVRNSFNAFLSFIIVVVELVFRVRTSAFPSSSPGTPFCNEFFLGPSFNTTDSDGISAKFEDGIDATEDFDQMTLAGSLDPNTGIFYRTPEHPRLRTAQACEKCRTRKAKCSGEHPSCKRCINRGLICEYAKEGRVRGPNKAKNRGNLQFQEASPTTYGIETSSNYTSYSLDGSAPSYSIEPYGNGSYPSGLLSFSSPSVTPSPPLGSPVLDHRGSMDQRTGLGDHLSLETPALSFDSSRTLGLDSVHRSQRPRPPDLHLDMSFETSQGHRTAPATYYRSPFNIESHRVDSPFSANHSPFSSNSSSEFDHFGIPRSTMARLYPPAPALPVSIGQTHSSPLGVAPSASNLQAALASQIHRKSQNNALSSSSSGSTSPRTTEHCSSQSGVMNGTSYGSEPQSAPFDNATSQEGEYTSAQASQAQLSSGEYHQSQSEYHAQALQSQSQSQAQIGNDWDSGTFLGRHVAASIFNHFYRYNEDHSEVHRSSLNPFWNILELHMEQGWMTSEVEAFEFVEFKFDTEKSN